jgi:hypothetical protein
MHDNQQNQSFRETDRVPSRFTIFGSLDERDAVRIVENQPGSLKIDAVLNEVALVLFLVLFEVNHAYVQISTYDKGDPRGVAAARYGASRDQPYSAYQRYLVQGGSETPFDEQDFASLNLSVQRATVPHDFRRVRRKSAFSR